jgi:hypothetical protein
VVKYLPSMHKALASISSTTKSSILIVQLMALGNFINFRVLFHFGVKVYPEGHVIILSVSFYRYRCVYINTYLHVQSSLHALRFCICGFHQLW